MRKLLCLLVLTLPVNGQIGIVSPLGDQWKDLRDYLGLTTAQIDALQASSQPYWEAAAALDKRREVLEREILDETGRSPLRPADLGRLHVEYETVRRQLAARGQERNERARALLQEAQLEKLRLLETVAAQRTVLVSMRAIGLAPPDCADLLTGATEAVCQGPFLPAVSRIPEWGSREADDAPDGASAQFPRLAKFLGLTAVQLDQMEEIRRQTSSGGEVARMRQVAGEILQETQRGTLDAFALGVRYAELEALRRKMSEDLRKAEGLEVALLTAAQKQKLEALVEALRLRPTLDEARSAQLVGSRCREKVYVFFEREGPLGFSLFRTFLGDCPDRRALEELP